MKIVPQLAAGQQGSESIEVHIDELVLHGFAPGARHQIARAIEAELARLMGQPGAPQWQHHAPEVDQLNGGAFRVQAGAKPQAAGAEIARAVFRSLRHHAHASRAQGFRWSRQRRSGIRDL